MNCLLCNKRDHKRYPLSFFEWIDAVQEEDIKECGKIVHVTGTQLLDGWRAYKRYWKDSGS